MKVHPRRCSSSGGSYPIPRALSVPTSWEARSVSGSGFQRGQSTPSVHAAQKAHADPDLETDSDHNFRMSTGPVTPLPQEPQVHDKRDMFGQRARSPTSWAIRSVPRVPNVQFILGGRGRTEGQLPPSELRDSSPPAAVLSSRASYLLRRASSVLTSREAQFSFPMQYQWGQSTPSVHEAR